MKEVVTTWEMMKFSVVIYYKGTQERGFVLGAVDEILLAVDNDALNLQSMAGSRFVGPFLGPIQQWEKDLSLISETIEVCKNICTALNLHWSKWKCFFLLFFLHRCGW